MHSFGAAIILSLCGLLGGLLTAAQVGQTSETRTGALTSTDLLVSQEVVIAKEAKTANSHQARILASIQAHTAASQNSAPGVANAAANTESRRIQNIAPEEMWNRVAQCVFPKYPALAIDSHITGTVDIGIGVSPEGDVGKNSRVLDGPPLLVQSAMDAIRQWKFRPNEVQGEVTWSRARALVRFNTDGTTAVDFAPAILADNFGDPGTPKSAAAALPRPSTSPACKSVDAPAQAAMFVDGAYIAGIGGLSYPKCVACPDPSYSDQARSARVSGIVVLRLIVTAEGHASNIQVTRSLGYGLDENAIESVRNWQFKPVVGLEDKPVPVWTDIEVNFRIK
jgi:TonB family protein